MPMHYLFGKLLILRQTLTQLPRLDLISHSLAQEVSIFLVQYQVAGRIDLGQQPELCIHLFCFVVLFEIRFPIAKAGLELLI